MYQWKMGSLFLTFPFLSRGYHINVWHVLFCALFYAHMYMSNFDFTKMRCVLKLSLFYQYIMNFLCHHQTYLIVFKVFCRSLDVPEVINISLLMPLIYLLFFFLVGGGEETITNATLHGHSFKAYIFLETEMINRNICASFISIGTTRLFSEKFKPVYTSLKGIWEQLFHTT